MHTKIQTFVEEQMTLHYLNEIKIFLETNKYNYDKNNIFISYARGIPSQENLVKKCFIFLLNLGFNIFYDNNKNKTYGNYPTTNIKTFIKNIKKVEYVILFGSKQLMKKYNNRNKTSSVICKELKHIKKRLQMFSNKSVKSDKNPNILILHLDKNFRECVPKFLHNIASINYSKDHCKNFFKVLETIFNNYPIHEKFTIPFKKDVYSLMKNSYIDKDKIYKNLMELKKTKDFKIILPIKSILIDNIKQTIIKNKEHIVVFNSIDLSIKTPIDKFNNNIYLQKIFEFLENNVEHETQKKHIFIQGDSGSGKTVLCKQIAYAWATNKALRKFEFVFFIDLNHFERSNSEDIDKIIENIILQKYFNTEGCSLIAPLQLIDMIYKNNVVWIIKNDNNLSLTDLSGKILNRLLTKQFVIIAFSDYFISDRILQPYEYYIIFTGFKLVEQVKYIKHFMNLLDHNSTSKLIADKLIIFLKENSDILSLSLKPLFINIICMIFHNMHINQKNNPQYIILNIYSNIIEFLIKHYFRENLNKHVGEKVVRLAIINYQETAISFLGKIAFLTEKNNTIRQINKPGEIYCLYFFQKIGIIKAYQNFFLKFTDKSLKDFFKANYIFNKLNKYYGKVKLSEEQFVKVENLLQSIVSQKNLFENKLFFKFLSEMMYNSKAIHGYENFIWKIMQGNSTFEDFKLIINSFKDCDFNIIFEKKFEIVDYILKNIEDYFNSVLSEQTSPYSDFFLNCIFVNQNIFNLIIECGLIDTLFKVLSIIESTTQSPVILENLLRNSNNKIKEIFEDAMTNKLLSIKFATPSDYKTFKYIILSILNIQDLNRKTFNLFIQHKSYKNIIKGLLILCLQKKFNLLFLKILNKFILLYKRPSSDSFSKINNENLLTLTLCALYKIIPWNFKNYLEEIVFQDLQNNLLSIKNSHENQQIQNLAEQVYTHLEIKYNNTELIYKGDKESILNFNKHLKKEIFIILNNSYNYGNYYNNCDYECDSINYIEILNQDSTIPESCNDSSTPDVEVDPYDFFVAYKEDDDYIPDSFCDENYNEEYDEKDYAYNDDYDYDDDVSVYCPRTLMYVQRNTNTIFTISNISTTIRRTNFNPLNKLRL